MTNGLKKAWEEVLSPLLRRPERLQVAAICYTQDGPKKKVLLITSRDSRRWIVPKGWPIDGMNAPEAAAQEAWEEAGVRPQKVDSEPVGSYRYCKELDSGATTTVETLVYKVEVDHLEDNYPEADERDRRWVSPDVAADMVAEPELQSILRQL